LGILGGFDYVQGLKAAIELEMGENVSLGQKFFERQL
jgi:hypothetical protein